MKLALYLTIAVLAAAAGFGIYRIGIGPRLEQADEPELAAARAQGAADEAELPERLPDFTLADLEGTPRSILGWPGKSMIVNFWATWCAPCRREIPLLIDLQREHGPRGYQVVGVAVDFREDVVAYAREMGIDYPVLIGEQDGLEAVSKFGRGTLGFPFTVFTDAQHRIVLLYLGEIEPAEADVLLGVVDRVNRGELTPAAARPLAAQQLEQLAHGDG